MDVSQLSEEKKTILNQVYTDVIFETIGLIICEYWAISFVLLYLITLEEMISTTITYWSGS